MVVAAIVWLVMTLVSYFQGDNIMLSMSGAKRVSKEDLPILHNVVEEMTLAAGLPQVPAVYVIDDPSPNAFATGRKPENAAVAVTSGLLRRLNRDELQGVIAHEIAHVRNLDIRLMLFAGVLVGAIVILSEVGLRGMWFGGGRSRSRRSEGGDGGGGLLAVLAIVLMILAPILAQLIYFAVSRKREYLADASAATFTRYPEGLASALEKISRAPQKLGGASSATAPMYIINPLKRAGKKAEAMAANSTSTHPPIDERVRILRSMSGQGFAAYDDSYRRVHGGKGVLPGSALQDDGAAAQRAMAAGRATSTSASQREIARQIDDFFYRSAGYRRIECECGAVLKLPQSFAGPRAVCPRCGKAHAV
jgi:heat shock protein HtpX